jgi:hypothetical protein
MGRGSKGFGRAYLSPMLGPQSTLVPAASTQQLQHHSRDITAALSVPTFAREPRRPRVVQQPGPRVSPLWQISPRISFPPPSSAAIDRGTSTTIPATLTTPESPCTHGHGIIAMHTA